MKPTLTIAITAYNEADNIGTLLTELLKQKITSARLVEIVTVSDASTDDTDRIVQSFESEIVRLQRLDTRGGSIQARNKILRNTKTDLLVILDADILPENKNFIEKLTLPIIKDSSVGVVNAALLPAVAKTFIESVLAWNHNWKQELYRSIRGGENLYTCFGPAQAFSKEFYTNFSYPDNVPYDAYSYMYCRRNNAGFVSIQHPRAVFRCPANLHDHAKQSARFVSGKKAVVRMFGDDAKREYGIPSGLMLRKVLKEFLVHPIYSASYFAVWLYVRVHKTGNFTSLWEMADSSKKLSHD